ncbi:MAG: hypothetical protein F6K54_01700 [Okeania sp. SIO3B5]|uniref:hypothetical protein n=1 Tax=Okeania sp. SIO3B5 TaxID=2607811 RepID=UPI0013FE79B7|nr:hypothetical protein [Okeania sp. SIO3B5]NEO51914.1 hypothetical protein [Okeania sp. SIO3B5]
MKTKQLILSIITTALSLFPQIVNASPIQCYIGKNKVYQICDMQKKGGSQFLITWPDTDKTLITLVSTQSGEYADILHARSNGDIYGRGTRYLKFHYEQGKWLCFHRKPGGQGGIDFCITAPK